CAQNVPVTCICGLSGSSGPAENQQVTEDKEGLENQVPLRAPNKHHNINDLEERFCFVPKVCPNSLGAYALRAAMKAFEWCGCSGPSSRETSGESDLHVSLLSRVSIGVPGAFA